MKMTSAGLLFHTAILVLATPFAAMGQERETKQTSTRKENTVAETLIRQRVKDYADAINARNIDGVMSLYAPEVVSFDVNPPLRYAGMDNKRRAWQEFFAAYTGPITYEVHELKVETEGELAFVHSLNHVKGTAAGGHVTDLWVRWTACFRRIGGAWLVVHDHVSVPVDLKNGKAVLSLTPSAR